MEKCHTLMSFYPRPGATLLCPTTNDQASHCDVVQDHKLWILQTEFK